MVDYSKWDKFNEDTDDEFAISNIPKVTTLEKPSSITIGPNGLSINNVDDFNNNSNKSNKSMSKSVCKPASNDVPELWYFNGNRLNDYMWSQTNSEITIHLLLSDLITSKDLSVRLVLSYNNNFNDRENKKNLVITTKNNETILNKIFKYNVVISDDATIVNCTIKDPFDWEIVSYNSRRYLSLTVSKNSEIPGCVHWWDSVFIGDVPIDVNNIKGRQKPQTDVWNEAHRLFKEKIANNNKINIDSIEET